MTIPRLAASSGSFDGVVLCPVGLAVGHDQDHLLARPLLVERRRCRLYGAAERGALPGNRLGSGVVDERARSRVVEGRRKLDEAGPGEEHEPHLVPLEPPQKVGDLQLGPRQAVGLDVPCKHAAGDIQGHHHLDASLLHRLDRAAPLGSGQCEYRDGQGGEPKYVSDAPSPAADRPAEPLDEAGVAQALDGRAPLSGRPERHERHDRQHEQQVQRVRLSERHGVLSGISPPLPRRERAGVRVFFGESPRTTSKRYILGDPPEERVAKGEL